MDIANCFDNRIIIVLWPSAIFESKIRKKIISTHETHHETHRQMRNGDRNHNFTCRNIFNITEKKKTTVPKWEYFLCIPKCNSLVLCTSRNYLVGMLIVMCFGWPPASSYPLLSFFFTLSYLFSHIIVFKVLCKFMTIAAFSGPDGWYIFCICLDPHTLSLSFTVAFQANRLRYYNKFAAQQSFCYVDG